MVNFPNNLDEVTLIAEPESVRLKNYVEEDDSEFNSAQYLIALVVKCCTCKCECICTCM